MKIIKVIKFVIIVYLLNFGLVLAGGIDHFAVTLSPADKAKTGEAIDITIEAQDRDNNIITEYDGSILIFSESDPEAEFPDVLEENSYTFKVSDEGKVKFENAVKFRNKGTQDIYVYDLNDDTVLGFIQVNIEEEEKEEKIEIILISPEDGLTIGEGNIKVSGNTKKNHQVNIIVNSSSEQINTTSNSEGVFEKEITNLEDGTNKIMVVVLNSDNEIVGQSKEVTIKIDSSSPRLKSLKINPSEDLEPESILEAELISNRGLTEVSIIIDDIITKLEEEGSEGLYKGKIVSPLEFGDYRVDVILRDELGHQTKELGVDIINVKRIELEVAGEPEKKELNDDEVSEEKDLNSAEDLEIKGLKLTKLKTKSVLTWNKIENVEDYYVYKKLKDGDLELIENVQEPRFEIEITGDKMKYDYFAVKAVTKTSTGILQEGNLSEAVKIQTGPEIWVLLIISMLIGGLVFFSKKKRA